MNFCSDRFCICQNTVLMVGEKSSKNPDATSICHGGFCALGELEH